MAATTATPSGSASMSAAPPIKARTIVDNRGRVHAYMPDGWPAHEPWRGAAIHAQESGPMDAVVAKALDRLLRGEERA